METNPADSVMAMKSTVDGLDLSNNQRPAGSALLQQLLNPAHFTPVPINERKKKPSSGKNKKMPKTTKKDGLK